GQRKRALQPAVLQYAEMLGVEAIETAHRGDALRIVSDQGCHTGSFGQLLDGVKYLTGRRIAGPGGAAIRVLACGYSAVDAVEALFGAVTDDAPVFGTPLVLHAPRLRIRVDVGAAGFEGRKIAALADHPSAAIRFCAPLAAEKGLARLRRLKQGDRGQSAKQQELFHLSSPGLAAQCEQRECCRA